MAEVTMDENIADNTQNKINATAIGEFSLFFDGKVASFSFIGFRSSSSLLSSHLGPVNSEGHLQYTKNNFCSMIINKVVG